MARSELEEQIALLEQARGGYIALLEESREWHAKHLAELDALIVSLHARAGDVEVPSL